MKACLRIGTEMWRVRISSGTPAIFAAIEPTQESLPLCVLTTVAFRLRKIRTIAAAAAISAEERIGNAAAGIPASSALASRSDSGRQTIRASCPRRIISRHSEPVRPLGVDDRPHATAPPP